MKRRNSPIVGILRYQHAYLAGLQLIHGHASLRRCHAPVVVTSGLCAVSALDMSRNAELAAGMQGSSGATASDPGAGGGRHHWWHRLLRVARKPADAAGSAVAAGTAAAGAGFRDS